MTAASSACSAALKGNTNETAQIASYSPDRPTRRARARGRRAAARAGRPAARRRAPRVRARRSPRRARRMRARRMRARPATAGTRPSRGCTNAPIPASIAKATTNEQAAASSDLLGEQRVAREQHPAPASADRTADRRASACSSRSSATPPAASSTHRRTSTRRSRRPPPRTCSVACAGRAAACVWTRIGWPIVGSTLLDRAQVLRGESRRTRRPFAAPRGRARAAGGR